MSGVKGSSCGVREEARLREVQLVMEDWCVRGEMSE